MNMLSRRNRKEYLAPIPEAERHDMVLAYHAQLNSVDDKTRLTAARAWSKWERVSSLLNCLDSWRATNHALHLKDEHLKVVCWPRTYRPRGRQRVRQVCSYFTSPPLHEPCFCVPQPLTPASSARSPESRIISLLTMFEMIFLLTLTEHNVIVFV